MKNVKIIKITAIGSYLRLMSIRLADGSCWTIRISETLYYLLKDSGVPTAQKLRFSKAERKK